MHDDRSRRWRAARHPCGCGPTIPGTTSSRCAAASRRPARAGFQREPLRPVAGARAQAMLEQLDALHRYPDPLGADLKRALAARARRRRGADPARQRLARIADAAGAGVRRAGRRRGVLAIRLRRVRAGGAGRRRDAARGATALPRDAPMPRGHDLDAIAARDRAGDAPGLPGQSEQSDRHLVRPRRARRVPGARAAAGDRGGGRGLRRDAPMPIRRWTSALPLLARFPNMW